MLAGVTVRHANINTNQKLFSHNRVRVNLKQTT